MFARFWGKLLAFFFGGILGTVFGIALGFFLFPYVFPPPPAVEQLTQADLMPPSPAVPAQDASAPATIAAPLATGTFIHANPSDPVHWGKGKVSIYQRAVFLEPDFEVGPGPAFHVYLVPKSAIRSSSDMKDVMYVDLGRLRSFKGSQRYEIPDGVNLKDYPSVIIWCERFGVLISPADLKVAQAAN
jgi:Electron transfer DM13